MKVNLHQPTATEPQLAFWDSPQKYRAFIGGIGSGKTYAGAIEVLRQPAGSVGTILAPTYSMLKDATFKTLTDICEQANIIKSLNRSDMTMELVNGSKVLFRTADNPDRLRGANLGWFWLDEAGMMKDEAWLIMLGRIRLSPGKAWVTTTPKGLNWLHSVFVKDRTPEHALIQSRTVDNTFLPIGFVDSIKGQYSSLFAKQELEGEFIDDACNLIDRKWWKYYSALPKKIKRYVWSWDTAFEATETADYSVGTLWAECDTGYYLVKLYRSKLEFPELKKTVDILFTKHQSSVILIERKASGHSLVQELKRGTKLPIKPIDVQGKGKVERMVSCLPQIESGNVYLPSNAVWLFDFLEELSAFPSARMNDDQVDSVSQALTYMAHTSNYKLGFI